MPNPKKQPIRSGSRRRLKGRVKPHRAVVARKTKRHVGATISIEANYELGSIDLTPKNWAGVKAGKPLTLRGKGYYYEGKFFWDRWAFNTNGASSLHVGYGDGGELFVGSLHDATAEVSDSRDNEREQAEEMLVCGNGSLIRQAFWIPDTELSRRAAKKVFGGDSGWFLVNVYAATASRTTVFHAWADSGGGELYRDFGFFKSLKEVRKQLNRIGITRGWKKVG